MIMTYRAWLLAFAGIFLFTATGCRRSDGPDGAIRVTGTILLSKSPMEHGVVRFESHHGGVQGSSARVRDGHFETWLLPGEYGITVTSDSPGPVLLDDKGLPIPTKSLVAKRYRSIDTSGLTTTIGPDQRTLTINVDPP